MVEMVIRDVSNEFAKHLQQVYCNSEDNLNAVIDYNNLICENFVNKISI